MACREPHESLSTPNESIPGLPDYGWRMKLDYECTEKCKPFQTPRLSQLPALVGLGVRYYLHMMKCRFKGRRPHMDFTRPILHKPMYGCPMGGLGTGTIGRGYRGEFCRFQMVPGMYEYHIVQADAFIVTIRKEGQTVYQKVLTGMRASRSLKTWDWGFPLEQATYQALFPRAWTVYDIPEFKVKLTCEQISPVIPHDYKDTSFPMTAFIWTAHNSGSDDLDISITFTFKNGQGSKKDRDGGVWTEPFNCDSEGRDVSGVMINQSFRDMKCVYALAGAKKDGVSLSYKVSFDPQGTGADLWDDLHEDGKLIITDGPSAKTVKGKDVATAVCLQCSLKPGQSETLEFSLCWDMPLIHFRSRELLYARRYTRWFGRNGDAGPRLSSYCLQNYKMWQEKIEAWQNKVLNCSEIPAWYKSALFNELYYLCDGGTVWLDPRDSTEGANGDTDNVHAHIKEYSKFAYLEGQEYRMYNTYDVHFYASFALIMLWPKLQLSLQYDYGDAVLGEDNQTIKYCMHGIPGPRKTLNTAPHDVGDPEDEPWKRVNSYNIHPTHDWKDLNLKFVLQVYRDYYATQDKDYLEHMYPIMKALMESSLQWDTDEDGMIENGGFADQTFDAWIVHGVSAYCGSLWLCALRMFVESAKLLGHTEDHDRFVEVLNKAKESYEIKLWNGKYYNYDCSTSGYHDSIMADQLAGNWYLKAAGIFDNGNPVFPDDHVKSALQSIFDNNVMKFANGNMGAINGTRPDGKKDISSCQSEEFWVGVTYGLAAQMIQEGFREMAFKTAWGNYNVCWEWLGLMFQSPEAYMTSKHYRSLGYMRPLAIWAMQWALEKYHGNIFEDSENS